MRAIAVLAMLITTVATVTVGVRLLRVAWRTRRAPELLFGLAFLANGAGQAFGQIGQRLLWTEPGALATGLNTLCYAVLEVGTIALFLLTRRLFHPDGRAASWLAAAGIAATLLAFMVRFVDGDYAIGTTGTRGHALHLIVRVFLMGWLSGEAFRHFAMARRRRSLGLADPLATLQLGLYALSAFATLWTSVVIGYWSFVVHVHPLESALATGLIVAIVIVLSSSMWCAFFPPAWLRRRIERSAVAVVTPG